MERKLGGRKHRVRGKSPAEIRKLILRTVIRSCMKVTTGASRASVAARLHVPEQSLAEYLERRFVSHVLREVCGLWHGDSLQGSRTLRHGRGWPQQRGN